MTHKLFWNRVFIFFSRKGLKGGTSSPRAISSLAVQDRNRGWPCCFLRRSWKASIQSLFIRNSPGSPYHTGDGCTLTRLWHEQWGNEQDCKSWHLQRSEQRQSYCTSSSWMHPLMPCLPPGLAGQPGWDPEKHSSHQDHIDGPDWALLCVLVMPGVWEVQVFRIPRTLGEGCQRFSFSTPACCTWKQEPTDYQGLSRQ